MNLREKTQLDLDIEQIEQSADTFLRSITSAITTLNDAHKGVWSLPDNRLQAVLQYLSNVKKLQPLLENHHFAATYLNSILQRSDIQTPTAITTVSKPYILNEDGSVVLAPTEEGVLVPTEEGV
jgi:hypothetical protein